MWQVPLPDNSCDNVVAIHVIEHAPRNLWLPTLAEWYRLLKPGGQLHVDTPNMERNIRLWSSGAWIDDLAVLTPEEQDEICGDRDLWLNFKMFSTEAEHNVHYGNFTPRLLVHYCETVGFDRVEVIASDPSLTVWAWK